MAALLCQPVYGSTADRGADTNASLDKLITNSEGNNCLPEAAEKAICSPSGTRATSNWAGVHLDPHGTLNDLPAQPIMANTAPWEAGMDTVDATGWKTPFFPCMAVSSLFHSAV